MIRPGTPTAVLASHTKVLERAPSFVGTLHRCAPCPQLTKTRHPERSEGSQPSHLVSPLSASCANLCALCVNLFSLFTLVVPEPQLT